jgi:hypothetical protein
MASDFPGSPLLLKGALVVFEAPGPVPTNIIIFQYNPETMTRRIEQVGGGQRAGVGGAVNLWRNAGDTDNVLPPTESFQLSIELDASDQLEVSDPEAMVLGLQPALAALELLLYPPSTMQILGKVLALVGSAFVIPPAVPLVLFVWGPTRVVPVRVTEMSITEQAFDQLLNPTQARVELGLRSLTVTELQQAGAPFGLLELVRQIAKEGMAHLDSARLGGRATINAAKGIRGMLPF